MTVRDAAKKLGMGHQEVRVLMRRGKLPIGICQKHSSVWQYIIFDQWVARFLAGDPVTIPAGMTEIEGGE